MEIRVWEDFNTFNTCITIYEVTGNKISYYNFYSGMCQTFDALDVKKISDEYIMKIPRMLAQKLFKALADTLDTQGIKTESSSKIEGTLEATKYHLEDLRKLLKLE